MLIDCAPDLLGDMTDVKSNFTYKAQSYNKSNIIMLNLLSVECDQIYSVTHVWTA